MDPVTIDVNDVGAVSYFVVKGRYQDIISNKRLLLTLKRLGYETDQDNVLVPFREENQIQVLQELQGLLSKYDIENVLSFKVKEDVNSYNRETVLFNEFANKAETIRNDEFRDNPQLIEDYKLFKEVLNRTFIQNLYPLQELSAFHMSFAQNSCNFSVPGAGKTRIVYAAYTFLKNLPADDERHVDKLLVIGPLSSFAPWEKEYIECFGKSTSFQRLSGDNTISKDKKLQHLYSGSPAEVTLIFHGGVDIYQQDIIEFLKKNKTMVVVDEAHRIKNPEGVWGKSIVEISKEAKARVVLTGTPLPNGYQDIYNLYKFIYPFKYKDILKVHYQNLVDMTANNDPDSSRVKDLKDNLAPFFIRIKKDNLELPPIEEKLIVVDMEPYQREIYDFIEMSYVNSFRINSSATIKDVLNKAKLIRLRQASTNPALLARTLKNSLANNEITGEYDPNSFFTNFNDEFVNDSEFFMKICDYSKFEVPQKFIEISKVLHDEILQDNGKAIIWTIFIQNAKDLLEYLDRSGIRSKLLIGEVEQKEREQIIDKFNDPKNHEFNVLIANPFAVAESISLHKGCHNAIYLERDYNCSSFLQSKDRIHRVGLSKDQVTRYYYILSANSIDEVITQRLNVKIERMEKIINDDIPLFSRVNDSDETDIIKDLIANYASRS